MIEVTWSSGTLKDSISLADAIELIVAFAEGDYYGRFTRANFQHAVDSENLTDNQPDDSLNEQFENALELIHKRASWLGDTYPFVVETDEIRFSPSISVNRCLPYLFLLICSNRGYVPSARNIQLDTLFENLCKEALRALFPDWAEVLLFSQKSEDRRNVFGWAASDAIPALAKKLNAELKNANELPSTQREFGIDIIAICPFGDQASHPFFTFAQCTVGQEWWEKKHEAIASNELTGFIDINALHSNFLMIPHFPRYNLEEWSEDPARTGNCILCDRYRICRMLEKSTSFRHDNPPEGFADIFGRIEDSLAQAT